MKCDICKKNKANIHYAEVINNKVKKLNICEDCAAKKGIGMTPPFSIGELLGGLTPPEFVTDAIDKTTCPLCGMNYAKFKETGRLGCSQCYKTFGKSLMPILRSIHRSVRHVGKVPSREEKAMDAVLKINEFEKKIRKAVENEEYELAAKFRDEMRELEKKKKRDDLEGKNK